MASTPEAKAKAIVRKAIEASGSYYFMPATGGFGKSGIPDFVGCTTACFWGCEVKADTDLTELQKDNLRRIKAALGSAFVVRITNGKSYGLRSFCEFLGVDFNEIAGKNQECGVLDKDSFAAIERPDDDGLRVS